MGECLQHFEKEWGSLFLLIFYCTAGINYWTDAECIIDSRDRKLSLIITVVYEREWCFNWLNSRAPVRSRTSKDWTTTREVAPSKFAT